MKKRCPRCPGSLSFAFLCGRRQTVRGVVTTPPLGRTRVIRPRMLKRGKLPFRPFCGHKRKGVTVILGLFFPRLNNNFFLCEFPFTCQVYAQAVCQMNKKLNQTAGQVAHKSYLSCVVRAMDIAMEGYNNSH